MRGGDLMEHTLKVGMTYESKQTVTKDKTAAAYGSGSIYVFATPAMIGLIENAALNCAEKGLSKEYSTVGIHVEVSHLAATPMNMEARAVAELTKIEGKKLTFKVEAFDEKDKIGEGTHVRYIINKNKFMQKINDKN